MHPVPRTQFKADLSWSHIHVSRLEGSGAFTRLKTLVSDLTYTLFLFTYTDYKTIFIPITIFASCCAPVHSGAHLLRGMLWIWVHLLQCNVSNQYKTVEEDRVNRPWRPIPSGRISRDDATVLRWFLCVLCVGASTLQGLDVALISASLTATMIVYDEAGLSGHWLGKNVSAVSGYFTFEVGATKIMGSSSTLDSIAAKAVACSAIVILLTIHCQDFADVNGDRVLGRVTIPIYSPQHARRMTMLALIACSVFLSWLWGIGPIGRIIYCAFGGYVGWRYHALRTTRDDEWSYVVYNLWLLTCHLLPVHARWDVLAF